MSMKKEDILKVLYSEFVINKPDIFSLIMPYVDSYYMQYCTEDFKKYYQGLMLVGKENYSNITCACFFSDYVIDRAIQLNSKFLIVKHPIEWVEFPGKFVSVSKEHYKKCLDEGLNVYVLHDSFDAHSVFSPSVKLAEALGFTIEGLLKRKKDLFGVISNVDCLFDELHTKIKKNLGLKRIQTLYFNNKCQRVGIVSGGGDAVESLMKAVEQNWVKPYNPD